MKLGREQIQALQEALDEVYDGYRNIVKEMNRVPINWYLSRDSVIELREKNNLQTLASIRSQISNIEKAVEELWEIFRISP